MIAQVLAGSAKEPISFSQVSVDASLETAVGSGQVRTFERRPDLLAERIEVHINGHLRFTGVLERPPGNPERGFAWTMRSLPVALLLTDADHNELFRNTTTDAIVNQLASRVNLSVGVTVSEPVKKFRLKQGVSYQRAIQALGEAHGFILTDNAVGQVVLYRLPDPLRAKEVWRHGQYPLLEIEEDQDIRDWRDEYLCRGQASPEPDQVADSVLGQIGVGILAGSVRTSRKVLPNRTARSKAQARQLVANEARKGLARSYALPVRLGQTTRVPGDLVRIQRRDIGMDLLTVVSSMRDTVRPDEVQSEAVLRLPDAYGDTGNFSQTAIDTVFV